MATECVEVSTAASPYAGAPARVRLALDAGGRVATATWDTDIYHPFLAAGAPVCACMVAGRARSEALQQLTALLRRPDLWAPCVQCVRNTAAWGELRSEPELFRVKAQVRTPGAAPLADEQLRRLVPPSGAAGGVLPDLGELLRTGAFSDVRVVVGRTAFRCHRTVLAARSAVLRGMFATQADQGTVRLAGEPQTFARLLQFIYLGRLTNK